MQRAKYHNLSRCGVPNIKWVDASYDTPCSGPESYGMYHGQVYIMYIMCIMVRHVSWSSVKERDHCCVGHLLTFDLFSKLDMFSTIISLVSRSLDLQMERTIKGILFQPCLIVKLNRVFGWQPEPYYNITEVFFLYLLHSSQR